MYICDELPVREIFRIMEASLTSISYRYHAPIRYMAFVAAFMLAGGGAAFFFAVIDPWIFRAICIFIMAVGFSGGILYLTVYLWSLNLRIIFTQNSVILPFRLKGQSVALDYSDISVSKETYAYGRTIRISTFDGREYSLDESRMPKGRFNEIISMFEAKTRS